MTPVYDQDPRIVMSLHGGGTNFRFFATRGNKQLDDGFTTPTEPENLELCLRNISDGFARLKDQCPVPPVAISFAFPGPADYPMGIIGDLPNLPAFRGGVALGPMLEDRFGIPVFINNDGDLFTYGEALAGFLPHVNGLLEKAGSAKRYRNLFGVTLGTDLGGGIVRDGELFFGDNSIAGEACLLHNKFYPQMGIEESASIRGTRRMFAKAAGISPKIAPEPRVIFEIATGKHAGNQPAAIETFRQLGEVLGDAMAQALTLLDSLAVVGGGLSGAWSLISPALIKELNSTYYAGPMGTNTRRLAAVALNLNDPAELEKFLLGDSREIVVPGSGRKVKYDALQRIGVGVSHLGTSQAIAIGAYTFALRKLSGKTIAA